jgi:uncharacterized membrane protein YraQ (UPF0718 family)
MKKFIIYLIAAIIIGIIIFIISYWVFSVEKHIAISLAISGAIPALIAEYLRPYFIAQGKKQEEDIYKRVTRNLGKRNKQIQ